MQERINEIKEFLIEVNRRFPDLKFKCGHGSSEHTYIVEVYPLSEFNNNEIYAKMELDFSYSFEDKYKECDIIFVSEEDICKVEYVLFEIGYGSPIEYKKNNTIFDFDFDSWLIEQKACEINYALAA